MGIPMDSIHAPTVPSGPAAGSSQQAGDKDDPRRNLEELIQARGHVESELKALAEVLQTHGVDMNTPLLTPDGFPRNDIDVAQIRVTRVRIIHLRNDYKDLMLRIEQSLHEYHASGANFRAQAVSAEEPRHNAAAAATHDLVETPFAKVQSVTAASPAAEAGLRVGDSIRRFGNVNWLNHDKLSKIAELVQQNIGRPIVVHVLRRGTSEQADEELQLNLTPRRDWGGRGLLGCFLVPA